MLKLKNMNGARARTIEFIWQLDAQGRLTATPRVVHHVSVEAALDRPRLALTRIGAILIERRQRTRVSAAAEQDELRALVGVPGR